MNESLDQKIEHMNTLLGGDKAPAEDNQQQVAEKKIDGEMDELRKEIDKLEQENKILESAN